MPAALWFTTRSSLFRPGDHVWNEVCRYADPLRDLLARRYATLDENDREDLVQEILIEIKQKLVDSFDRSRGSFRGLLKTVVRRRVVDRLRRAAPQLTAEADAFAAPESREVEALDLEATLLHAVSACHDRFTQGPHKDLQVAYVLSDRLIHGMKSVDIARKEGLTERQVARRLGKARDVIFSHVLARELDLDPDDALILPVVDAFKQCLRRPRGRAGVVAELAPSLREPFQSFFERFLLTLELFSGGASARARELARGMELIFKSEPNEPSP